MLEEPLQLFGFPVLSFRFPVSGFQFQVSGSRFAIDHSLFTFDHSRFTIHDSRFTPPTMANKKPSNNNLLYQYMGFTMQLLAGLALAVYAGFWADRWIKPGIPVLIWLLPRLTIHVSRFTIHVSHPPPWPIKNQAIITYYTNIWGLQCNCWQAWPWQCMQVFGPTGG